MNCLRVHFFANDLLHRITVSGTSGRRTKLMAVRLCKCLVQPISVTPDSPWKKLRLIRWKISMSALLKGLISGRALLLVAILMSDRQFSGENNLFPRNLEKRCAELLLCGAIDAVEFDVIASVRCFAPIGDCHRFACDGECDCTNTHTQTHKQERTNTHNLDDWLVNKELLYMRLQCIELISVFLLLL